MAATPLKREYTPLHDAIYFGRVDDITKLVEEDKVPVNAQTERKETPMHYALCHNKVDCIEPLLKLGANPNKRTMDRLTPLILGVMQSSYDAIDTLIKVCKQKGVDLDLAKGNFMGENALHFAACHNHLPAVKIFVEAGADVNQASKGGATPLLMAKENGHTEIVEYLRSKGATEDAREEPVAPAINIPDFLKEGHLNEDAQKMNETRFGGCLWQDRMEGLYSGKKPRIGLCVEINTRFVEPVMIDFNRTYTWMRGIIHTVSEDKQTVIATVKLNSEHEGHVPKLAGEWEATLKLSYATMFNWILTSLVPVTNPDHSYAKVLQTAKDLETQNGKRFVVPQQQQQQQQHQHGDGCDHDHDHGDHGHSHGHGDECGDDHGDHGHSHGHGDECGDDHGDHGHSHGHGGEHGDHGHSHGHGDHGDHGHSHGHGDHGDHGHSHGHGGEHGDHGHSHAHGGDHGHSHGHGGHGGQAPSACWILKGMTHQHEGHEAKVADEIELREDGTIKVNYEDGESAVHQGQRAQMLFSMIIGAIMEKPEIKQNVRLKLRGQQKTWDEFLAGAM